MKKDILIGVDLGTTTLKAVFVDATAAEVVTTQIEEIFPTETENSEWIEYNPKDWFEGTIRLLKRGFEDGVNPERVAGICFTGWTSKALFADERGAPIINAVHYNDMRHMSDLDEIEVLVGKQCVQKNRNYIGMYNGLAKHFWWKKHRPEVFSKVYSIHTEASWMVRQLTGIDSMNRPEAAFYGYYNAHTRQWDDEIIETLGFPRSIFPKLYDAWEIVGGVTEEASKLTGLPVGTPVVAGADDASPVALTTGVTSIGQAYVSSGSGANLAANTAEPVSHPTIITFPHCIPGLTMAITVMSSTGLSNKWMRNTFCQAESIVAELTGGDPYDFMNTAAENVKPGSNGVVFLPYLDGDFTPNNDSNARGCFVGMDSFTTRADMLRAVLEGVSFSILDNIMMIREVGGKLDEIVLTGGLSKSDIWMQIIADTSGCTISLPEESEGAAFGGALIAGYGTGVFSSPQQAVEKMVNLKHDAFKPNVENVKLYEDLFKIYRGLYPALKNTYSELASFRKEYQ